MGHHTWRGQYRNYRRRRLAGQCGERVSALREYLSTINGPAQAWFSKDGTLAFVASQKASQFDVIETGFDRAGRSHPKRVKTVDIRAQDPRAFTPFLKNHTGWSRGLVFS